VVGGFLARQLDGCAVVGIVYRSQAELRLEVEVAERPDLPNPPIRALEDVFAGVAAHEYEELGFEDVSPTLRVEDPIGEQVAAGPEHLVHEGRAVDVGLAQVARHLSVGSRLQMDLELAIVGRPNPEGAPLVVHAGYVARDHIREREAYSFQGLLLTSKGPLHEHDKVKSQRMMRARTVCGAKSSHGTRRTASIVTSSWGSAPAMCWRRLATTQSTRSVTEGVGLSRSDNSRRSEKNCPAVSRASV